MNLKRLAQITIEDKYSRHDRRAIILRDMKEALPLLLSEALHKLDTYFTTNYSYASKNNRIGYYLDNTELDNIELVMEILLITLPLQTPVSIQSVVGKLAEEMGYEDIFSGVKTAAEVIAVVGHTGLYDVISAADSESGSIMIRSNYALENKAIARLDKMKYLPPMICAPEKVWTNSSGGYLTKNDSVILGKGNHHDDKLNLAAINQAASVKLSLDLRMLKLEEEAKAPSADDSPRQIAEKAQNHLRLVTTSNTVYDELIAAGNEFYLTWKFDKRGRIYSQGFHVNIQSTSYKKSLINLATPQIIEGV